MKRFSRKVRQMILEFRCELSSRFSRKNGVGAARNKRPVIVSLTTTPERLGKVHIAVECLLGQTRQPDKLVLWLSEGLKNKILPLSLRKQTRRGLEVQFVEDIGPHTKAIYALKHFADWRVVTADDDVLYPRDWLRDLAAAHEREPDCVTCHRAHRMIVDKNNGTLRPYTQWDLLARGHAAPSMLLFPTGVGGVLYPPGTLHPEVFNQTIFRQICPTADDVWFKAMSLLQGARCQKVRPFSAELLLVRGTQQNALGRKNFGGGLNNVYIRAVFERYGLYHRLAG
jgi:hypothetical protein